MYSSISVIINIRLEQDKIASVLGLKPLADLAIRNLAIKTFCNKKSKHSDDSHSSAKLQILCWLCL